MEAYYTTRCTQRRAMLCARLIVRLFFASLPGAKTQMKSKTTCRLTTLDISYAPSFLVLLRSRK